MIAILTDITISQELVAAAALAARSSAAAGIAVLVCGGQGGIVPEQPDSVSVREAIREFKAEAMATKNTKITKSKSLGSDFPGQE
jgi:hypothetical protein